MLEIIMRLIDMYETNLSDNLYDTNLPMHTLMGLEFPIAEEKLCGL